MRIEIKEYCDIRRVENHIREVMQCQGQHCSFLQSMPYKNIQITLLLKLNRVISHDVAQHVHMGNGRFLHMHPCASVIEIVTMNEDTQKNNMEDAIPGDNNSSHFHHSMERKRKRNTNEICRKEDSFTTELLSVKKNRPVASGSKNTKQLGSGV